MIYDKSANEIYTDAKNKGKKEYNAAKARGRSGHLTSLDGLLKDVEIVTTVELGIREIPLKKVVGTYSNSRRMVFSKNFMPLEAINTEFGEKWVTLCKAHLEEGIRDPIKVYEYMNYFYVMEGNKRVSVLKYFDAEAIEAQVFRLIPKYNEEDEDIKNYYEFLDFYRETNIMELWVTKGTRYKRLTKYLKQYDPELDYFQDKYVHFLKYVYRPFRKIYLDAGGASLPATTGDAFTLYAKLYGIPDKLDIAQTQKLMPSLMLELKNYGEDESIDIFTDTEDMEKTRILSTLTSMLTHKKLKVGFVYARNVDNSGWTYSHELGRKYLQRKFKGQIETDFIDNVGSAESPFEVISEFAEQGFDVIFTTSEIFRRATLRCALEHPNTKFFNCSGSRPYVHMSNYFGRTYETRFLTGMIAGAMTKSNIVGYTAPNPNPETVSCINAFAMGAKMVNPNTKVYVSWSNAWNNPQKNTDLCNTLIGLGADIVSSKNVIVSREETKAYGINSMLCSVDEETKLPDAYLAAPIWKWEVFYEKIVGSIINGTYEKVTSLYNAEKKLVNFWWGMASGGIDVYCSTEHLPVETIKLVNLMKKLIISDQLHPFSGPVYDNQGAVRVQDKESLTPEAILEMDWFVDNVKIIE